MPTLSATCVYTTHHSNDLEGILMRGGSGTLTERTYWKTGSRLHTEARAAGEQMAVLLSGAETDAMDVAFWALLTEVDAMPGHGKVRGSTTYSFERLRRIEPPRRKSELRRLNGGSPLSDDYLRPYVPCHTPAFIFAAAELA